MCILKLWQEKTFTDCVGPAWFIPVTSKENQIPRTTNYPQFHSPQDRCLGLTGSIPRNRGSNTWSRRSHRRDYSSPAYSHSRHYRSWWWTSRWNSASCNHKKNGVSNHKTKEKTPNYMVVIIFFILSCKWNSSFIQLMAGTIPRGLAREE